MARTSRDNELFDMLRARGLRKRAARLVSDAARTGRGGSAKGQGAAKAVIADLRKLADDLEDRVTGRGTKRKEAAKKAARTRARKASARSAAAKKGAATRKKASSTGRKASTTRKKR